MTNPRPFIGTIGYVGRPTNDGRTLTRVDWRPLPLPVQLHLADRPLPAAPEDRRPDGLIVGKVDTLDRRPDGSIIATGTVEGLEPGRYDVGIDCRLPADASPSAREFPATIVGLTVHTGGAPGDASAWTDPDAAIEVR